MVSLDDLFGYGVSAIKVGEVGVDSGTLMIGDPCYFSEEDDVIGYPKFKSSQWLDPMMEQFSKDAYPAHAAIEGDRGVAFSTADGDGTYSVYQLFRGNDSFHRGRRFVGVAVLFERIEEEEGSDDDG